MSFQLSVLPEELAIVRLPVCVRFSDIIQDMGSNQPFWSITKTNDEWSFVIPTSMSHQWEHLTNYQINSPWKAIKVLGPLDFELTGILHQLSQPLAKKNISLFSISTFDTDYILVKSNTLKAACNALQESGYNVVTPLSQ